LKRLSRQADSGLWSWKLIDRLNSHRIAWSTTVRQIKTIKTTSTRGAWCDIDYPAEGQAQVAETTYIAGRGPNKRNVRLIVRRTRLSDTAQSQPWPDWWHHAFITSDHNISTVDANTFHRNHAVVVLAIRDLKAGAGLEHIPSGHYAAWLACAVLAHNLGIWADLIADMPRRTHRSRRPNLSRCQQSSSTTHAKCRYGPSPLAMGRPVQHYRQRCPNPQADPNPRDLTHPPRPASTIHHHPRPTTEPPPQSQSVHPG